jgi:hypothetical protein
MIELHIKINNEKLIHYYKQFHNRTMKSLELLPPIIGNFGIECKMYHNKKQIDYDILPTYSTYSGIEYKKVYEDGNLCLKMNNGWNIYWSIYSGVYSSITPEPFIIKLINID